VRRRAADGASFRRELDAALAHYAARRFAEARDAFLRARAEAPPGADLSNLDFNVAACDYELGDYRQAEQRFVLLAGAEASLRGEALLHAGWAALGSDDPDAAAAHLAASPSDSALAAQREALEAAITEKRRELDGRTFDEALREATQAYERGDLAGATAAIGVARAHASVAPPRSRAALEYLSALVARERGDDVEARAALERADGFAPGDGMVQALLGELAREDGDAAGAERHYRASLASDLSPRDSAAVREALDALYALPSRGVDAWAALGAGYDSNATLSGSSDALGLSSASSRGSAFVDPALGLEYRFGFGERARLGPYYAGDWLVLTDDEVSDVSLQTHEAGLRLYWAPIPSLEVRLTAGGGITLSGLAPSPFSLDGLLRGRLALRHGARLSTALLVESRPSLGLSGQDYLTGARSELSISERYSGERWAVSATLGYRHVGIGTEYLPVDPQRFERCTPACGNARYVIPLGYAGPLVGLDGSLDVTRALSFGAGVRYEHRVYLDESRIEAPFVPDFVRELSEKTRVDDRYSLLGRARYRFRGAPEIGLALEYSLRLSRSNVAYREGDLEHAFDYDDRNFDQHIVELSVDFRF
jgi:tetratricopeptide (TPR) repeat protein